MRVKRHFPNFVGHSREPVDDVVVNGVDALLELAYIKSWMTRDFDYWEAAKSRDGWSLLVAHLKNGEFWVVAHVEGELKLPSLA